MEAADHLTAPAGSIPRRDPSVLTLADCWRAFVRERTPPLLAAALVAAVALRLALGHYDWRDAVVVAGVVAATPLVEWAIHVYRSTRGRSSCSAAATTCSPRASTARI